MSSSLANNTRTKAEVGWSVLDGVLLILILFGNILTICAVCWCRRIANILSNHFVLSLAVSDLLVGLVLPYHMAFYLSEALGNDKETCVFRFVLLIMPCCVSMYNLIVIAVDRYIAIIHPLHYHRLITRRVATILIAIGWFTAGVISTVPVYWNTFEESTTCELHEVVPKYYILVILTPAFSLVLVAMICLYWRIWKEAAGHAKRLRNSQNLENPPSDWKSFQMVMLILGCFSFCWLPFFIVIVLRANNLEMPPTKSIYPITFSMGMANSAINPLIYAWKNSEFKRAFGRLLRCQSPNRSQFPFSDIDTQLHTIVNATKNQPEVNN